MADGAGRDGRAEREDALRERLEVRFVQGRERLLGDRVEIGPIALHQLDDDRLLRLEVVVEAPGQDAAGVGDVLQRGPEARRREQVGRGVEELCSTRTATRLGVHGLRSLLTITSASTKHRMLPPGPATFGTFHRLATWRRIPSGGLNQMSV